MESWFLIFAYILGSFPTGYLISRWSSGKNVLEIGWRKNSGSNVYRNVGKWQGVVTGLLDAGKGYLAVFLARYFGFSSEIQILAGASAVLGHNWSCFLKFAGGRGIGTFAGALLAFSPKIFGLSALSFVIFTLLLNMSLGTLVFLATVIFLSAYFNRFGIIGTSGLFALLCVPLILIKRLSPIKEIFPIKGKNSLIRNRLLFDYDQWVGIRIKKFQKSMKFAPSGLPSSPPFAAARVMEQIKKKLKVTAIVPAYNEEKTIGNVLQQLLKAKELDEIILACDGSTDKTAEIGRSFGVKVLKSPKEGKGQTMREAVAKTDAEIIAFFDADLIGLVPEHVSQLVEPIFRNEAAMVVGIRDRAGETPPFLLKIDPLLAFGGERALKRSIFERVPEKFGQGFAIETALNYYCKLNKLPVLYVKLKGLDIVMKEKKVGIVKGFWERLEMHWYIRKMRFLMKRHKEEFKRT